MESKFINRNQSTFLDIGSVNKLKKYGVDVSHLELLYTFNPRVSNRRIYRWPLLARPE